MYSINMISNAYGAARDLIVFLKDSYLSFKAT